MNITKLNRPAGCTGAMARPWQPEAQRPKLPAPARQRSVRRPPPNFASTGWLLVTGFCAVATVASQATAPSPPIPAIESSIRESPDPETTHSLAEIQQALSRAETVFARFTQERHLAWFAEPLRSEGFLCSEQPGRLRWEITGPYRSILVSDGRGVAQFEWVEDAWLKLDLGLADALQTVTSQIGMVVQGRYASQPTDYTVKVGRDADGPTLTLLPRAERIRRMLQSIEIRLAPDLQGTREVVLREATGDFTRIEFTQQQVNRSFPAGTFDRTQPLDIELIRAHLDETKETGPSL